MSVKIATHPIQVKIASDLPSGNIHDKNILMNLLKENIQKKHRLLSASWKRSIQQQVVKAKEDDAYRENALHATYLLQNGHRGYRAIWNHIINVSVSDLKRNYANLNVSFDLWKGESDAQAYIPDMIDKLKKDGFAHEDQGALVIDVQEETDTKERFLHV